MQLLCTVADPGEVGGFGRTPVSNRRR